MVPEVTGSDILSYRGDPGLAAGAGNGGILPQQGNPFQGIQDTLARAQENEAQMRVLKYQQRMKEQDQLAKDLAATGDSVFNMGGPNGKNMSFAPLPDDKKVLDEKADELTRAVTSNPRGYKFDPNVISLKRQIDQLNAHAQIRAVAAAKFNQDAAASNDENERADIQQQMKSEIFDHPLDDFHTPTPHLPHLSFDPETFIPRKELENQNNWTDYNVSSGKDAQGNIVQNTLSGVKEGIMDFRPSIIPGSTNYTQAVNMANSYLQSTASNPALVQKHNENIDAINKARGYVDADGNPTNVHYIPHVADVVNNPDGSQSVVLKTKNPADIVYSMMAERVGGLQQKQALKKTAEDVAKDDLQAAKTRIDMEHTKKLIEHMDDDKTKSLTPQQKADQEASIQTVARVGSVYNPYIYPGTGTPIVKSVTQDKDGKEQVELRTVDKVDIGPMLQSKGLDPKDYGVFKLPSGTNVEDLIGVERRVKKENGSEERTGESITPDHVLVLKNNKTKDIQLAFLEHTQDDKGKKKEGYSLVSLVDGREAVANAAKHKHQYKGEKLNDEINRNESLWNDKVKPNIPSQATSSVSTKGQEADEDDEAKILARSRSAKVKSKDGRIVDVLIDPVTNKMYVKK